MRSASRLYYLNLALGTLGVGVIALAVAGALRGVRLDPGSLKAVISACEGVLPSLGLTGYVELALAVFAAVTLLLAVRSLITQLRATRRYRRDLGPTGETIEAAGAACRVIGGRVPRALCAGYLAPRVYVSRGAIETLSPEELRAVVAHELHHCERRDPLRLLVARGLADALFFLPALKRISRRYAELVELAADEAAIRALGERGTLARAMLKFGDFGLPSVAVARIAPERVDHLSGDPAATRWELSTALLAASALVGAALFAGIGLLLAASDPAPVNLFLVLAQSCMLMILASALAMTLAGRALWRAARA